MDSEQDKFKTSFKYFKSRNPPPDLSKVVDFDLLNSQQILEIKAKCSTSLPCIEGIAPVESWKVYQLNNLSDFYFIRNPFEPHGQRYWAYRCLRELPDKPNVCNLDAHMTRDETENIWDNRHNTKPGEKTLMDKLRWVTLGYHHNWETKVYNTEERAPFPADLSYLVQYIVAALEPGSRYHAEAAIVNYYHMDSTLAGHTDHSEFDLSAPLISVSFGQPAIFLIGGTTKTTEPVPMFLRSGDIVVMSGRSRLAYHAIPRVISEPTDVLSPWLQEDSTTGKAKADPVIGDSEGKSHGDSDITAAIGTGNFCEAGDEEDLQPSKKLQKVEGMKMVSKTVGTGGKNCEVCCTKGKESCLDGIPNDLNICDGVDKMCGYASQINDHIKHKLSDVDFKPFGLYLKSSRININVRQVFKYDENSTRLPCGQADLSNS